MAERVSEALEEGTWLMVEAGTGVGKSLAYLVPAALWCHAEGKRVVVSTYTKTLQDQLVRKDLEALRRALSGLSIDLRFALLMGSNNYACSQRLKHAMGDSHLLFDSRQDASTLQRLAELSPAEWSGRRQDLLFTVESDVWNQVCRDPKICLGRKGPSWHTCYWRRAMEEAREAQILVINHALFFANESLEGGLLPPHDAIIFDEAHRLEEAFLSFASEEASNFGLRRLLDDILREDGTKGLAARLTRSAAWKDEVASLVHRAHPAIRDFFDQLLQFVGADPSRDRRRPPHAATGTQLTRRLIQSSLDAEPLTRTLLLLADRLNEGAMASKSDEEEKEIRALSDQCKAAAETMTRILGGQSGDEVRWAEALPLRTAHRAALRSSPIEVGDRFNSLLSEKPRAVVFTSATLATEGSFSYVRSQLGLAHVKEAKLDSPFNYREQALLYLSTRVPDPRNAAREEYLASMEAECTSLLQAAGGGTFILFTNYKHLEWMERALQARAEFREFDFFVQGGRGTPTQLLEDFRKSRKGVLLGTMTFWQGVDVPGEALRCVIVTKLPFEPPDHPMAQARAELIASRGGNAFAEYGLPQAILLLRQGVGRLIRSAKDRGVIAILDSRVLTKSYGARFVAALPPMPQTQSLPDATKYFTDNLANR